MNKEYKFGVTGQERKRLVGAISEILNAPMKYLGAPTFAYEVGSYHIDKAGMVTGEYDLNLFVGLAERGIEPEPSKTFHLITPRGTLLIQERFDTAEEAEAAGYGMYFHHEGRDVYVKVAPDGMSEHSKHFAVVGAPFAPEAETQVEDADTDRLTLEVPVLGFNPLHIENLTKMVLAKEALLKKALDVDELPIRIGPDTLQFPWFPSEPAENADCYAQFIHALCETAKQKKRVTAKPQDFYENEAFSMRVWLIGLGLVGKEYSKIRRLLGSGFSGNSAWRFGRPDKAKSETATELDIVGETPEAEVALAAGETQIEEIVSEVNGN